MEAVEEAVSPRVRRQRSKRPRHATSTSSAEVSGRTTEEEEDMANCLILLAQGGAAGKVSGRRPAEAATTGDGRAGLCVYECKTCSKRFPSFQALGGHRASHKKIKPAPGRPREAAIEEETIQLSMNSFSAAEVGGGGRARVHECSMCRAEFSSGQALGGHMRRHRPVSHPEVKKERSGLSLDLNLPAPSDDTAVGGKFPKSPSSASTSTSAFPFAAKPTLLFSSSALVNCHY